MFNWLYVQTLFAQTTFDLKVLVTVRSEKFKALHLLSSGKKKPFTIQGYIRRCASCLSVKFRIFSEMWALTVDFEIIPTVHF